MADNNNNDEFSPSTYIGSVPKLAKFHGFIWRYATKMRANEATDEQVTAVAQLICREDAGDLYNAALDMVPELRGEQVHSFSNVS